MSTIDWSSAPNSATHHNNDAPSNPWYMWVNGKLFYHVDSSGAWLLSDYSEANLRNERVFTPRPVATPQPAANDLPPVGAAVLVLDLHSWKEGTVVAHVHDSGGARAVIQCQGFWCHRGVASIRPMQVFVK